jgi:hypothetical protein
VIENKNEVGFLCYVLSDGTTLRLKPGNLLILRLKTNYPGRR